MLQVQMQRYQMSERLLLMQMVHIHLHRLQIIMEQCLQLL